MDFRGILVHLTLVKYLYYHFFQFNSEDLTIFLQFLLNYSDIIINLYSTELIYFLPEKIFLKIKNIVDFLRTIGILLTNYYQYLEDNNNTESNINSFNSNSISKFEILVDNLC